MSKRMTVVFDDEELYIALKVEAVRSGRHAKDIVAEALREWLEDREDAELVPVIEAARAEWEQKGGRPWSEVEQEIEDTVSRREGKSEARSA
jgi:hypothetical protein